MCQFLLGCSIILFGLNIASKSNNLLQIVSYYFLATFQICKRGIFGYGFSTTLEIVGNMMIAGPLVSDDLGFKSTLSCLCTCYEKAPGALAPISWLGLNATAFGIAAVFPDLQVPESITMTLYVGSIVFLIYFLKNLEPLLDEDPFRNDPLIEVRKEVDKSRTNEPKATIRYREKCDLLEWQCQERTRQKRICNISTCRRNKHKRRRSAESQQNHKEKKRERRERTSLSTKLLHNSNNAITLFLLLWFETPSAEPLETLYNSLIHSNVEWESVPKRHVPNHRMVHLWSIPNRVQNKATYDNGLVDQLY